MSMFCVSLTTHLIRFYFHKRKMTQVIGVHCSVDTLEKMKTGLGTLIRDAGDSKRLLYVTENIPSCSGQAHLYCICYTLNNVFIFNTVFNGSSTLVVL